MLLLIVAPQLPCSWVRLTNLLVFAASTSNHSSYGAAAASPARLATTSTCKANMSHNHLDPAVANGGPREYQGGRNQVPLCSLVTTANWTGKWLPYSRAVLLIVHTKLCGWLKPLRWAVRHQRCTKLHLHVYVVSMTVM